MLRAAVRARFAWQAKHVPARAGAPLGVMGVFPYLRTVVQNMDKVIVYVMVHGVRRCWVLPPAQPPASVPNQPVQVTVESVPMSLGAAGSPPQAFVGTPWALPADTAGNAIPLTAPCLLQFPFWLVGNCVMGSDPVPGQVSVSPVQLSWTEPPLVFPPAITGQDGALRFTPLTCSPATNDGMLYTGVTYAVYDNSVARNKLRAYPDAVQAGVYNLAWAPASPAMTADDGGAAVTVMLVWPSCSVPTPRIVLPAVVRPARARLDPCAAPGPLGNGCRQCPF